MLLERLSKQGVERSGGGTDILIALHSISAIFGLTQNTFIVFNATAFSFLGLR